MNGTVELFIDGQRINCAEGGTILEAASANGVRIPTLCSDERVEPCGACGVCAVEDENSPKLLRACSTAAREGMKILTGTARVIEARRSALELLLSDHTGDCAAPCKLACPAGTDCQGYAGLIANGEYREAAALIMEKIPLPASIGRVCPHPCEDKCRRALVEAPVNIAGLKTFAAERAGAELFITPKPDTGKRVSIIGGGPGGLSAAYFLRAEGHGVTVYDRMPKMGGMLRYGVPEYRLPKAVLDREIERIKNTGVTFINNTAAGVDFTLSDLRGESDAVIVAVGAWSGAKLGVPGEELENVVSGIGFLADVSWRGDAERGESKYSKQIKNKRVAVVGGGDAAMDACRTAIRLGASAVYDIYRRSRSEMPANETEIIEAEEEGVIFKFLHDPIEITGDGRVSGVRLQKNALGEPDKSGRRAPVALPGEEELLPVDLVIVMIGQTADTGGLNELATTKKNTVIADEHTFETNLPGVFAIGDAINNGAGIAVEAIGDAARCAKAVHGFLTTGRAVLQKKEIVVTDTKTAEDYVTRAKEPRITAGVLPPESRRDNFKEIGAVLSAEQATREAARCLECGCAGYFECRLIAYANEYGASPSKYGGAAHSHELDANGPYIYRDMNKCVLCGLCVRVCDEVAGVAALGFMNRGFETVVRPELNKPHNETSCNYCGMCAALCPTGAIGELVPLKKRAPFKTRATASICDGCGAGCGLEVHTRGRLLIKRTPAGGGQLCREGRFGFIDRMDVPRVSAPMIKNKDGGFRACSFAEAAAHINARLNEIAAEYGGGAVGVSISDGLSNEEIAAVAAYARDKLRTNNIFTFGEYEDGPADELASGPLPARVRSHKLPTRIKIGVNGRGLRDAGIKSFDGEHKNIRALLMFGADAAARELPELKFLAAIDAYETDVLKKADCVLPAAAFFETDGTYTGADGTARASAAAMRPLAGKANVEIIELLSKGV